MKFIIPLDYFDKHGRVKPHWMLWLVVLFMLRPYFVLVMSLATLGQDSGGLLAIFYPQQADFYRLLVFGLPAWFIAASLSFRESIANNTSGWLFSWIKPLILLGLLIDILAHVEMAFDQKWRFSWSIALSFLISSAAIFYCWKSRMLKAFIEDWREFSASKD